jgi:hypothetical protein
MFLFGIPSMFIIPYFLGKRYDKVMKKYNLSIPSGFGFTPPHIYRSNVYAINIVVFPDPKKHPNKMKQYKLWHGNFCFREHASTWDKIQAWYIVITASIFIITAIIVAIMSFID